MGGGGGFLAGFTSGLGQTAKDMNQNYMDMQLKRYSSAAKIWESMANDPNIHPTIRQQFSQNALALGNVNLFDKNSRAAADQILKQNPHDSVQKALDAMSMTGQQMPSYYDKNSGQKNLIEYEKQAEKAKYTAQMEAQLELLKAKQGMFNNQPGGNGGSDYTKHKSQLEEQKLLFGSAIPSATEHMVPYLDYTTKTGQKGNSPAIFLDGKWFNQAGEEVTAHNQLSPQTMSAQNPSGGMEYYGVPRGVVGPTGIAAPPRILGNTVNESTDPVNLTRTSHTVRQLTPIQGNPPRTQGGPSVGALGSPGAVAPPRQPIMPPAGSNAAEMTFPGPTPVSSPSDIYKPPAGLQKSALTPSSTQRLRAAWTGLQQSHRIASLVSSSPELVGPVMGRAVELGNRIGSAELINFVARFGRQPSEEEKTNIVDSAIESSLPQAAKELGIKATAANKAGQIFTAMRAMNAAEVSMLNQGGGHGITRMYQMLVPVLMNPTQSPELIFGHMESIDTLFADNIRGMYRDLYGDSPVKLSKDQKFYAERMGVLDRIMGNVPGDSIIFKAGPHKGQKGYKYPDGSYDVVPPTP